MTGAQCIRGSFRDARAQCSQIVVVLAVSVASSANIQGQSEYNVLLLTCLSTVAKDLIRRRRRVVLEFPLSEILLRTWRAKPLPQFTVLANWAGRTSVSESPNSSQRQLLSHSLPTNVRSEREDALGQPSDATRLCVAAPKWSILNIPLWRK